MSATQGSTFKTPDKVEYYNKEQRKVTVTIDGVTHANLDVYQGMYGYDCRVWIGNVAEGLTAIYFNYSDIQEN